MTENDDEIQDVLDQLSALNPPKAVTPQATRQAYTRLQERIEQAEENRLSNQLWRILTMFNRKIAYGAAFVLLFGIAFTFPQVRAAASDFLGLFRVQQFTAVSISPQQLALLEQVAEQGLTPGEVEILNEPGQTTPADSLEAARLSTGLETVRTIPSLGDPTEIYTVEGGNARLTIDLKGAQAIVAAVGGDPALLPDSLDGAQVDVSTYAGVEQSWEDGTTLMQTESPVVEYPEGLDPAVLGEALLQVLGLDADEAHNLAQTIDWTSTLLLPIPRNVATFHEVSVNGVSGMAISSLETADSVLLWQDGGMVYVLAGQTTVEKLLELAGSMQ